jgi:formyl-CoA transferase
MPNPPLTGLRVFEMTNYIAGPYCGMVLGDLGADVVKVENPATGDFSRGNPPFIQGEGAGFMALNRNKRSVAINLKHPEGRDLFLRLADTADVIIENFRPGTTRDLGVHYEAVRERNPGVIYASVSAFGQTGPYGPRAGLDLIVQGMSGLMSITGEEGGPPIKPGAPIADLAAALYTANAIQAAYIHKLRTGEGQYIDVSLFEAAVALEAWETSGYLANGEVPKPLGSAHRTSAPYQAFRTADGYITLGATSPNNWNACCAVLGAEALEHDPRFETNAARKARQNELADLIEAITLTKPSGHWYRKFEEGGVPCGVLNRIDQVVVDPHLIERGFVVDLKHSTIGTVRAMGSPMHLSASPVRVERAGPLLGEHTDLVLAALGLGTPEVDRLVSEGVVARAKL